MSPEELVHKYFADSLTIPEAQALNKWLKEDSRHLERFVELGIVDSAIYDVLLENDLQHMLNCFEPLHNNLSTAESEDRELSDADQVIRHDQSVPEEYVRDIERLANEKLRIFMAQQDRPSRTQASQRYQKQRAIRQKIQYILTITIQRSKQLARISMAAAALLVIGLLLKAYWESKAVEICKAT